MDCPSFLFIAFLPYFLFISFQKKVISAGIKLSFSFLDLNASLD